MQIQDLRVGNWVHHKSNCSYRNDGGTFNEFDFQIEERDFYASGECTLSFENDLEPILLNKEWFFKFGFSKSVRPNCEDIYKDLTVRMVLWFNEGNYAEMDLIQDDKRISFKHSHIKYVHQLQNFYYALTGVELSVS
jgi:beta-glucosidase/6-phospho-beta-glucosidase/beta-galactosidase